MVMKFILQAAGLEEERYWMCAIPSFNLVTDHIIGLTKPMFGCQILNLVEI